MEKKHQWNSVSDGSWGQVQELIKRTMRSGKESRYGKTARMKTLTYNKRKIIVTFVRQDGKIKIGNAWVKRK
ncbi:polymorphic toxin type 35 domain-containing protein [Listeria innocua]|uniref:polymorphic toxin type 35 domain-containing protein n=1 Tax=Listeria innocua TaxID=1642 RepID=UPI0021ADA8D9|nr:polymorphic toxin type 35 domain-containing protein [Listeria innocua]